MSCAEQQQQQQQQQQKQKQKQQHIKNWCVAELPYEEYVALCKGLWEEYDTHYHYRFNICDNCRRMKLYPIYGQLAYLCKFCSNKTKEKE